MAAMPKHKTITLGLQGGGSHGAYTWGVLDRLLADGRIDIEGISGASAGAMNAVALAQGLAAGGRDEARAALARFWEAVAQQPPFGGMVRADGAPLAWRAVAPWMRMLSPYQFNPFDINPLRGIVEAQFDFARLRSACPLKLFIATTRVATGELRLFTSRELTPEVLLASACLPTLHHSVMIDGEAYWDGGLAANPAVFPLVHRCSALDLMLVLLEPLPRPEVPATREDIALRLSEIGFGAALHTELQALAQARHEARRARLAFGRVESRLRALRLHLIESRAFMSGLATLSKANTDAGFIAAMRDEGRRAADAWLAEHFPSLGTRSTFHIAPPLP